MPSAEKCSEEIGPMVRLSGCRQQQLRLRKKSEVISIMNRRWRAGRRAANIHLCLLGKLKMRPQSARLMFARMPALPYRYGVILRIRRWKLTLHFVLFPLPDGIGWMDAMRRTTFAYTCAVSNSSSRQVTPPCEM